MDKEKFSRRYDADDVKEMIRLTKELGSARKAARELGVSYTTILENCHKQGMEFVTVKQISEKKKSITIDGFRFTKTKKNYYRGKTDNGRETASQYLYRKIYGAKKPNKICIYFKDGNNDNYDLANICFITLSERMKIESQKRYDENVKLLDAERKKYFELEKQKPHLRKLRMRRVWNTRRSNDPDNISAKKAMDTRRKIAEKRGFFYTDQQRQNMSDAHKGKSKKEIEMIIREREKASLRQKMGIAV